MKYRVLVIDDDKMTHLVVKNLLGDDYQILQAFDTQEAVNILAEEKVNLILSDIHMPGVDGLEFLESMMADSEKRNIPVLIMTGQPTVEKEKAALNLGAADFIRKEQFKTERDQILELVQAKLVTTIEMELPAHLQFNKKEFVKRLMDEVHMGDFFQVARRLSEMSLNIFDIDHIYFWTIHQGDPRMVHAMGVKELHQYGPDDLLPEPTYKTFLKEKKPYVCNHAFGDDDKGIFKEDSKKLNLPAEIGIPLYKLTDKQFLKAGRKIPPGTDLFAYIVLKRNKLFSTKEFKLITSLYVQAGTILWRMYQKI
ncbi:response regulator [Rhodohalobacter halophilus]|uniref:response regulator n=1 Tax=Rhodohalobacter halophilus TaxID=1812810 RepID=UPI00083F551A|nr:response regulator [Rhodohalobacter halophilus]